MKKFAVLLLSMITLFTAAVTGAEKTRYVYNGSEASVSSEAIFKDGKIFLPASEVFKLTKVKVIEKTSNNSITVEALGKPGYASVWLNSKKGRMNGQDINISAAPFKNNGVFYVPSDFVAEQIGVEIKYDKDKNTIYIDTVREGKITSTVGQAQSKTTSSGTSAAKTTSTSSGGSKYYPGTNILDFGQVTGKTGTGSGKSYEYKGATSADARKYLQALAQEGFEYQYRQGGQLIVAMDIWDAWKGSSKVTINCQYVYPNKYTVDITIK